MAKDKAEPRKKPNLTLHILNTTVSKEVYKALNQV